MKRSVPAPPTHVLRVEHPSDSAESWEVSLTTDDDSALARMASLAGKVFAPRRVRLYRTSQMFEMASAAGFRRDAEPGQ